MNTRISIACLVCIAPLAEADPRPRVATATATQSPAGEDAALVASAPADPRGGRGLEVNVLWPFFPGGISELRFLQPLGDFRGALVLGTYSDFASRFVRDDTAGKVANLSAKVGWRQFIVGGLHAEVSANLGWRHEEHRPPDDVTVDGFQIRLWTLAGYEHALSQRFYVNARGGVGIHLYRSDELAALEKKLAAGGDLNVGVRF